MNRGTKKIKTTLSSVSMNVIAVILLFMVLFPFYVLIVNSFKLEKDILLNPLSLPGSESVPLLLTAYGAAWGYVKSYILNTVLIAVMEIAGVLIFGSAAAYGFARFRFKGKEALFSVFLAFMMVPGILTLAAQYNLVYSKLKLAQTYWGVALPAVAGAMPSSIFLMRVFFAGLPKEMFEAAEIDGASQMRQFLTCCLPLSLPILFMIGLSTLLGAWNDLIWARLILYGNEKLYTISVGVFVQFNSAYSKSITDPVVYAGYCIVSLPLLIAFAFTSKQFIAGLTTGAIKM